MQKTKIQYLTHTWNPIAMRCTPVSEGCRNCWHIPMTRRLAGNTLLSEKRKLAYAGGEPYLIPEELESPLHLRMPAVIGVQFMGDLFHEAVPYGFTCHVLDIIQQCPQHKFMILTKRPELMFNHLYGNWDMPGGGTWRYMTESTIIPNLYLGVSVENENYLKRVEELLKIPAAKRFISFEPLLTHTLIPDYLINNKLIDQIIIGCESGPKRRPCKIEWVRFLVEQARTAGVKVFVKQLDINGKVSHKMNEWPQDLRIRNSFEF